MGKLFLFALFISLSFSLFSSQEEYEYDEWTKSTKDYCEPPFCETEIDEEYDETINENSHLSSAHPSYLSKMYFEGILNFNTHLATNNSSSKQNRFNWQSSFNSYLASDYYELFVSFKNNKKIPISINVASLRLSPLLMKDRRNTHVTPLLSFYIGSFCTHSSFKHLYNVNFSHISPTSKRRTHPALNNIKLSKTKGNLGAAFEIALPFFNFYFFWKNIGENSNIQKSFNSIINNLKAENCNEFGLYVSYKNNKLLKKKAKINIAFLSSFIQEKGKALKRQALSDKNSIPYTQVYAIDFNFAHSCFFFNLLNGIHILPKQKVDAHSLCVREEGGFAYKILSLNTGFSYEGSHTSSANRKNSRISQLNNEVSNNNISPDTASDDSSKVLKDVLAFYVQEKLKWNIFSVAHSYSLIKKTNEQKIRHSYGFFYSIGNKLGLFKNELLFFEELYTLKFSFSTHPNTHYFKAFSASSDLYLQNKNINLHIMKKYEVSSAILFHFTENFSCKIGLSLFQENEGGAGRRIARWKKEVFTFNTSFLFLFAQDRWKEKGSVSFKYSTHQHKLDILLKMRLEY